MPLKKPTEKLKIAILVPCYKRHDYSIKCLRSIFEADYPCHTDVYVWVDDDKRFGHLKDGTRLSNRVHDFTFKSKKLFFHSRTSEYNIGLRQIIINFFKETGDKYDLLVKIDNDCTVPKDYLKKIIKIFQESDIDIASPDIYPSHAAETHGEKAPNLPYMPTNTIGGVWIMKSDLIKDMSFEEIEAISGLRGAIPLLRQIVNENDPVMGWLPDVVYQDIGHWSGSHPEHIKSKEHYEYSIEVGREIAWS